MSCVEGCKVVLYVHLQQIITFFYQTPFNEGKFKIVSFIHILRHEMKFCCPADRHSRDTNLNVFVGTAKAQIESPTPKINSFVPINVIIEILL